MKWLLFLLAVLLLAAAGAGFVASLDLLTTELGLAYATCAAIAAAASLLMFAMGALAFRVDALRKAVLLQRAEFAAWSAAASAAPPSEPQAASAPPAEIESEAAQAPGEDREGDEASALPALPAQEPAPPKLVGRYSSGGANYKIYSDGSIDAETSQGAFRFASMGEFKAYIAAQRAD